MSPVSGLLINGQIVAGADSLPIINPATAAVFATAPRASEEQLQDAVDAARKAFARWSHLTVDARRAALVAIADRVSAHEDELAELIVLEQGKPMHDARTELTVFSNTFRAAASSDLSPEILKNEEGHRVEVHRRPLGVVAIIVPWNHPAMLMALKVAPALLAGNTVVIKPAPTTPLAALRICELVADLVPPGVINIVVDDHDLGPLLTSHPDVRKVSFTGSTDTGRRIYSAAAETLKRLTLEMGGNDPAIVFGDVDVSQMASVLFGAAFRNSGQGCQVVKRIFVQRPIYEEFCDQLEAHARAARVGDGMDSQTQFGPVQNKQQFDRVLELLEDAKARGAKVVGGEVISPGYFIRPAVVRNVAEGARVVDEEQFGPLVPVICFDDEDEVVERANRTEFGLGGSVWSGDPARAYRVASRIESGTVTVNMMVRPDYWIPFTGAKSSGLGVAKAHEGLLAYTQLQVVEVAG